MKMKKIKLDKEYRLKMILSIALEARNMNILQFKQIKSILGTIILSADTDALRGLKSAIKEVNNGNFLTEKEFKKEAVVK